MKYTRSPNPRLIAASRWEIRWSRSTCSEATPNCTATLSCSSKLMPDPTFHTSKCRSRTLIRCELCKSRRIASAVERCDRRTNLRLGISQPRATGKIEHGLFRGSDQRWAQWRFDALSIERVGITTDETNLRRAVCQRDRPVLAWNRDHRRRQRARYGSQNPCCADAHNNHLIWPVDRRCDARSGCFEPRQPGPAYVIRRDDDVVTVSNTVQHTLIDKPRDLGPRLSVDLKPSPAAALSGAVPAIAQWAARS